MKSLILTLALAALTFSLRAQSDGPFEIKSSVIAGGGAVSRSVDDHFALVGTIGQHEAAPALKSPDQHFTLEPGFWHGITLVQTPGAPELKIRAGEPGFVILSWPLAVEGFQLQSCADLAAGQWQNVAAITIDTKAEHTVTVPANEQIRLYRLRKL
jgi:hypothetical protein